MASENSDLKAQLEEAKNALQKLQKVNSDLQGRLERKNGCLSTVTKTAKKLTEEKNTKHNEIINSFKQRIKDIKDQKYAEKQEVWKQVSTVKESLKVSNEIHTSSDPTSHSASWA